MKWISVKERLPELNQRVLVYIPRWRNDCWEVSFRDKDKNGEWYKEFVSDCCDTFDSYYNDNEITHWMPLPEPPKD